MARPSANILMELTSRDGLTAQILETPALYILTFNGQPFGMRCEHTVVTGNQFRYRKVAYNNRGNAELEARRLNDRYNTDAFDYITIGDDNAEPF